MYDCNIRAAEPLSQSASIPSVGWVWGNKSRINMRNPTKLRTESLITKLRNESYTYCMTYIYQIKTRSSTTSTSHAADLSSRPLVEQETRGPERGREGGNLMKLTFLVANQCLYLNLLIGNNAPQLSILIS